jgi:hypothetical protein
MSRLRVILAEERHNVGRRKKEQLLKLIDALCDVSFSKDSDLIGEWIKN